MRCIAVINRNSGYVMQNSPEAVQDMLRQTAGDQLARLDMVAGEEIEDALKRAFADAPDAVIVLGGDGTARSAAEYARDSGVPLIPLPGGTMNLLPRRLYGEGDPDECLRRALAGRKQFLDAGEVGGNLFFLQGLFGVAPDIARAREAAREVSSLEDASRALDKARRALSSLFRRRSLSYRVGPSGRYHRAEALAVSIGSMEHVMNPQMETRTRDFEVMGMRLTDVLEALKLGFHALTNRLNEDDNVHVRRGEVVSIRLRADDPSAVLDGETMTLPVDVVVRYVRDAAPVIAPDSPSGSDAGS